MLKSLPFTFCIYLPQEGRRILDVCQQKDSEHCGYWLAMAQLASINSQNESKPPKLGEPSELQCLLRAAEYGFNVCSGFNFLLHFYYLVEYFYSIC